MTDATSTPDSHRYAAVAIALHWLIALSIIGLIAGGLLMTRLPNEAPLKEAIYQLHKSVGVTVLILTVARIIWRLVNPPPPLTGVSSLESLASHLVHLGFYGLMIALPMTGWLYVSTAYEFDVPTVLFGLVSWPDLPFMAGLQNAAGHGAAQTAHTVLAWLAVALLVLHVGGALKHEVVDKHGVLKRMWPSKGLSVMAPTRGAGLAFGSAAAIFLAVAAVPVLATGGGADLTDRSDLAANWQIDEADPGEIAFSGVHDGSPYTGQFDRWTATIAFDPEQLASSRAEVTVDLGSAEASKKLYTDSLRAAEWFDVATEPTAQVIVSDFVSQGGDAYQATASLTLKGVTFDLPLDMTIVITGDSATMTGTTQASRIAMDLGMASDPGADWVDDAVDISVSVNATRIAD